MAKVVQRFWFTPRDAREHAQALAKGGRWQDFLDQAKGELQERCRLAANKQLDSDLRKSLRSAWVVDYMANDPDTGKKVRVREAFDRKGDANERLLEVHPKSKGGRPNAKARTLTVAQAAEIWLDAVRVGRKDRDRPAEPHTVRQYRSHLDLHILPYFGSEKLSDVTRGRANDFRDHVLAKLSRPMAKKVMASLKGIFTECEVRDLVQANPTKGVGIRAQSNAPHDPVTIPERAEVSAIFARLDELCEQPNAKRAKSWRRRRAFMATAILTGMRASEVRGLPWSNVKLDAGTIAVKQKAEEEGIIGEPKSAASVREINIPESLVAMLRRWKVECPPSKFDLVFPTLEGTAERHANITNRTWNPLRKHLGLGFRFHDLRHFHASMLIADGANPKEVQAEMGHSSIQVTYDLYGHLFKDDEANQMRKARAERLASSLGVA